MSPAITHRSIVRRSPDHVATDMAGETVVLDMKSGMYYGMEEVGALIWNFLTEPRTLLEIREAVLEAYEIDPESCDRDIVTFLGAMETAGLVEITNETTS